MIKRDRNNPLEMSTKYNSARYTLFALVAFSFINLFAISFGDRYFLFSSYFTQITTSVFYEIAVEEGVSAVIWVGIAIGTVLLVPYLLAAIFSKKHVGWMIAALVLFGVDSVLFFYDVIIGLAGGYFGSIVDVAFHVWALVDLILGVKHGVTAKKNPPAPVAVPTPKAEAPSKTSAPVNL